MKLKTEHKISAAIFVVVVALWVLAAGLEHASAFSGSAVLSVVIHRTLRQDTYTSLLFLLHVLVRACSFRGSPES